VSAEKFWAENLQHKYSRLELESSIYRIDIGNKGRIEVGDIVRFINFESDQYYRNRDLSLIFKRLSGKKGCATVESIFM
jgi:Ca2+-binding EF-hand superfamily protein